MLRLFPVKEPWRSLRKHRQTEAPGPGGAGEEEDWLSCQRRPLGPLTGEVCPGERTRTCQNGARAPVKLQTGVRISWSVRRREPPLECDDCIIFPEWCMFPLLVIFHIMSHFFNCYIYWVYTELLWRHPASIQPPHLKLETQVTVTGPSGGWFMTCSLRLASFTFAAFGSCSKPRWASRCDFFLSQLQSAGQFYPATAESPSRWQWLAPL